MDTTTRATSALARAPRRRLTMMVLTATDMPNDGDARDETIDDIDYDTESDTDDA